MPIVEAEEVVGDAPISLRQILAEEIEQTLIPVEEVFEQIPPTEEEMRQTEVVVE